MSFFPPPYYAGRVSVSLSELPILPPARPSTELAYPYERHSCVLLEPTPAASLLIVTPHNPAEALPSVGADPSAPVENAPIRIDYTYLHPQLPDPDAAATILALSKNQIEYRRRRGFLSTLRRGTPPPVATFPAPDQVDVRGHERADIRAVLQDDGIAVYEMKSTPWNCLDTGVVVDAVGALVGDWRITDWRYREGRWTIMLWLCVATRQYTLVRVCSGHVRSPTLVTRAKSLFRAASDAFTGRRPTLPATIEIDIQ
jgi:hypothetical protein